MRVAPRRTAAPLLALLAAALAACAAAQPQPLPQRPHPTGLPQAFANEGAPDFLNVGLACEWQGAVPAPAPLLSTPPGRPLPPPPQSPPAPCPCTSPPAPTQPCADRYNQSQYGMESGATGYFLDGFFTFTYLGENGVHIEQGEAG